MIIYISCQKETLDEFAPKLEDIIQFYFNNKDKLTVSDAELDRSHQSIIAFRSDDSSLIESSTQDSICLSESIESDDSPIGKKRKRKDSQSDMASFPSTKRSK